MKKALLLALLTIAVLSVLPLSAYEVKAKTYPLDSEIYELIDDL